MVNKEEFRKKIIKTSGQIFSRYGFRKTTMEEISKALKMGKSSVYYYFKSKEESSRQWCFMKPIYFEVNLLKQLNRLIHLSAR